MNLVKDKGWSDGAIRLNKFPPPVRPTHLEDSSARAYCDCSRCGWGCLDIFSLVYMYHFVRETVILSQRAVKPKTTNQPNRKRFSIKDLCKCMSLLHFVHIFCFLGTFYGLQGVVRWCDGTIAPPDHPLETM